jgi:transposase
MSRHDHTEAPWTRIAPMILQQKPGPGRKRHNDRHTLHSILVVWKTGCPGEDGPGVYGSPAIRSGAQ